MKYAIFIALLLGCLGVVLHGLVNEDYAIIGYGVLAALAVLAVALIVYALP